MYRFILISSIGNDYVFVVVWGSFDLMGYPYDDVTNNSGFSSLFVAMLTGRHTSDPSWAVIYAYNSMLSGAIVISEIRPLIGGAWGVFWSLLDFVTKTSRVFFVNSHWSKFSLRSVYIYIIEQRFWKITPYSSQYSDIEFVSSLSDWNSIKRSIICHRRNNYYTSFFFLFQALSGFLLMMTQNGKLLYISDNAAEYLGHSMVSFDRKYFTSP